MKKKPRKKTMMNNQQEESFDDEIKHIPECIEDYNNFLHCDDIWECKCGYDERLHSRIKTLTADLAEMTLRASFNRSCALCGEIWTQEAEDRAGILAKRCNNELTST